MMIFKYCVWPTAPKDENEKKRERNIICGDGEYGKRLVGNVLRCCPCAFRWRQAIGVDEKEIEAASIVNQVHRLTNTPVITLRSNKNTTDAIDKNIIEEEDHNEINKRHFAVQANSYKIQNSKDRSSQCPARINNGASETSSNESSNVFTDEYEGSNTSEVKMRNDRNAIEESFDTENNETVVIASPVESCSSAEKSFDVITHETNPSRRNSIDYGISSRNIRPSSVVVYTNQVEIDESETEKDSSADEQEEKSMIHRTNSSHESLTKNHNYDNSESSENEKGSVSNMLDGNIGTTKYVTNENNSSEDCASKISQDSPISNESHETEIENLGLSKGPTTRVDSLYYATRSIGAIASENSSPSTDENDVPEITTISYVRQYSDQVQLESGIGIISPRVEVEKLVRSEIQRRESREENVISIIVASRPHSPPSSPPPPPSRNNEDKVSIDSTDFQRNESLVENWKENFDSSCPEKLDESTNNKSIGLDTVTNEEKVVAIQNNFSRDSSILEKIQHRSSNTENDSRGEASQPTDLKGTRERASTSEKSQAQKRAAAAAAAAAAGTSRISRMRQKSRTNLARVAPMRPSDQRNDRSTSKSRTLAQQCFTQLESNDWEVTVKGLRGLSHIARQEPEQLDTCAPLGTVGRLLGRHVRNLRSQVSRAACLAAGDVFSSQARCIDQDLDDIAGPLLHRTADTNKFLRADSNEALDRMVEHLPPNKTILVIVHRGATHQNAIVRATTARLLASIVDRVGPEGTMSMPRDVREKLIATGAKLLMDGNLEARNQAKRMFRKLSRCEVFRKVLKDSVPETTLRHIDKTLRSL